MANTVNPYALLGVPDRSAMDVCQRAYRKLAKQYHPDVCKDPKGKKKFIEMTDAINFLRDPSSKLQLDQPQSVWQTGPQIIHVEHWRPA